MSRAFLSTLGLVALVGCKEATKVATEKVVKVTKDTVTGISEGIREGRKTGASPDEAQVVSNQAELKGLGSLQLSPVRANAKNSEHCEIDIIVANTSERPLRLTGVKIVALDKEGFAHQASSSWNELTVIARAKAKKAVGFSVTKDKLKTVRIWGQDYPVPIK